MKASEIREMSIEDIQTAIEESREELMRLRFQAATGELTDFNQIRYTRRKVARLETILNELQRAVKVEGGA